MTDYLQYTPNYLRHPSGRTRRRLLAKKQKALPSFVSKGRSSFGTSEHGWKPFKCYLAPRSDNPIIDAYLPKFFWENNRYSVITRIVFDEIFKVPVLSLSFKDYYRTTHRDWRDFQNIKNELAGMESRAFEVYPEDSHLMDTANQFWLWCFPVGHSPKIGLFQERIARGEGILNSKQRPFRKQDNAKHPKSGKAWKVEFCSDEESKRWLKKHKLA